MYLRNAIAYTEQATALFVKADVPYLSITLHASSNLATDVIETGPCNLYDRCRLPGGSHEVLDVVWSEAPVATSLDGLTDADTAQTFQMQDQHVHF
eukprot:s26_g3.t1